MRQWIRQDVIQEAIESCMLPVTAIPAALKFVKDAVVFIQGAQFTAKVFMNLKQKQHDLV